MQVGPKGYLESKGTQILDTKIYNRSIKILKEIIFDEQSTLHSSKTTFIRTYVGLLLGKRWD